jgi:hypothetical protein
MPTFLAWYDSTGTTPVSSAEEISGASGTPGTVVALQLINNKSGTGADPMVNARLKALFDDGGGFVFDGTEWADRHYFEARIQTGGLNTNFSQTEWKPLGSNSQLDLPVIDDDEGVVVGFRLNAPADALVDTETIRVRIIDSPGEAVSAGLQEMEAGGLYSGIRDLGHTQQVLGGTITEDSPQSRDVKVPDCVWISRGRVHFVAAQDVTIPNAAVGKERYDLLSLDADGGGVTRTAGTEVDDGTSTIDDRPAIPAGDLALCYVYADESAQQTNIVNANIVNVWALSYYALTYSGLQATCSAGPTALIDNALIYTSGSQNVGLTDDDTNYLWLNRNGTLEVTLIDEPPNGRDLPLYEVDTASGVVTATRDRRLFIGGRIEVIDFHFAGEITGSDVVYKHLHNSRPAWILPLHGFAMSAGTQQSGASSGSTILDLERSEGGSWTSVFGTGSTKPQIAYDASDPRDYFNAIPDDFELPPNCRLRAQVDTLPSGSTTEAQDVTLTVMVVM